jgi:hypothetical protein
MSVTVSTWFDISRSCVNTSKAKQLYSIPKDERFHERQYFGATPIHYYNENLDSFAKKGASIGVAKKDDIFRKRDRTPSPTSYYLNQGIADGSRPITAPFKVALRDNLTRRLIGPDKCTYTHSDIRNPGPGSYNDMKQFKTLNKGPRFTMRPKTSQDCNLND